MALYSSSIVRMHNILLDRICMLFYCYLYERITSTFLYVLNLDYQSVCWLMLALASFMFNVWFSIKIMREILTFSLGQMSQGKYN